MESVADVIHSHTKGWFAGLIVFGSAVRGGFIPGCSDIDFHLFLDDDAFDSDGCLPLALGLEIHRDLANIDPRPFRYIQCTPTSVRQTVNDNHGPVPGTYRVVRGRPAVGSSDRRADFRVRQTSIGRSGTVAGIRTCKGLLDHGVRTELESDVTLLCTLKYGQSPLTCSRRFDANDPVSVWQLPKDLNCDALPEYLGLKRRMRGVYGSVLMHYRKERSGPDTALDLIEKGVACLTSAQRSWDRQERSQRRS